MTALDSILVPIRLSLTGPVFLQVASGLCVLAINVSWLCLLAFLLASSVKAGLAS